MAKFYKNNLSITQADMQNVLNYLLYEFSRTVFLANIIIAISICKSFRYSHSSAIAMAVGMLKCCGNEIIFGSYLASSHNFGRAALIATAADAFGVL